ncbi:A24 family peptidase [Clostridium carnis]
MSILVLILGLCIGSFLNVCIYRLEREESIVFPASHCTSCMYELKWKDLIPVISYLILRGKCRNCNEKISLKYPLIEILNSIIYILLFIKFGLTITFIKFCFLSSLLIVISMIDFETKYVYSATTIFGGVIGGTFIFINWYINGTSIVNNILGGLFGFGIIYLIVILTKGMGAGDAEIAGVCGLFLGLNGIIVALFLAVVLGGIAGVIILVSKLKNKKDEIAFGPYIAIGTIITIFFSNEIVSFYVNSFLK